MILSKELNHMSSDHRRMVSSGCWLLRISSEQWLMDVRLGRAPIIIEWKCSIICLDG
jgi:hypothetical protein